jgi:predicted O-methyltransferase YrrM
MRRVTSTVRYQVSVLRRKSKGIRPTSQTPYATHLPVLAALAKVRSVRHVLELGAGPYSTSLFLNRLAFPDVESLTSYEDDSDWKDIVLDTVGADKRLDFRMVDAVRYSVPKSLDRYDLIFIDDSRTFAERTVTVNTVRANRPRGVVAIHDFEERHYRSAARGFDHRVIFKTLTPQVGVCWFGEALRVFDLDQASRCVEAGRDLPLTDVEGWDRQLAELSR